MRHFDEDYESEAIEKCSRALFRLDDKAKIRVVRYLLDKFGLIAQTENQSKEVINQNIQYQQNNLVLAEPKDINSNQNTVNSFLSGGTFIAIKDLLIKNLVKSEPDLLVIICYYNSDRGNSTFTRQSILDSFRDNGIMTDRRRKNLSHNLNSIIKKSFISTITDEELAITSEGCEYAVNILAGNSTTKKRKPRPKKGKISKVSSSDVIENAEIENNEE